jgi:hypothetical protein
MTLRSLDPDARIAHLTSLRDWCSDEAFYYRRRGVDAHDRQHAIDLEDAVRDLDDVIGNLRRDRTATSGAPATQ